MNRLLYRIIFNKRRGALMAVAETASATSGSGADGGSAGAGTSSGTCTSHDPDIGVGVGVGVGVGSHVPQPSELKSVPRLAARRSRQVVALRPLTFSLMVMLGAVAIVPVAHAQIKADSSAPGAQRATVLGAGNGVPLVNIQTPSAAGVSRNTFSRFDVGAEGAILNNSRSNVQSQLGGWVQGNPWLAAGSARVILNEVNSSDPSRLGGAVEVAGSRAEVVIANPAGIICSGCGFLNANRATLTTGTALMNGGALEGYRVERGTVVVDGNGLDARGTDYTSIIARAVQVNAGVWASWLSVTTGANVNAARGGVRVDGEADPPADGVAGSSPAVRIAASGEAPAFALDVSRLGGMYAGKIMLVGTEAGVGVRNAGEIGASAGEVTITSDGRIENLGRITSSGPLKLASASAIVNRGTVYSQADAALSTVSNIDNHGVIVAAGHVLLAATGATSQIDSAHGSIVAAGVQADGSTATRSGAGSGTDASVRLEATQRLAMNGQLLAPAGATLSAAAIDLLDAEVKARDIAVTATAGTVDATRAVITADHALEVQATARRRSMAGTRASRSSRP